jgi:hypothetical protein
MNGHTGEIAMALIEGGLILKQVMLYCLLEGIYEWSAETTMALINRG